MPRPTLDGIRQASMQTINKGKLMVGLTSEEEMESQVSNDSESTYLDEAADILCPDMTFQQRLIGFASCFTIGYLITFMSFKFFIELIEGYPVPFALNYSFGNIMSLMSSCFLCGPRKQFKNLFDDTRRQTSIVYLSCLGATLVVVFLPIQWVLQLFILICLLITQCLSSFWYSLSYIPYGRRTVARVVKRTLGLNESEPIEGVN
mmetsp:Transcript_26519/g.64627  ORF Transcript_26519/g.64627 Transcript_26519/m.64627 type:complete len:205 (+) Transcript_26519:168-782(+)|eukprot:CAMPEP_0113620704 /NCGR_PEP_ID=MMETSP0017_2-20120614/10557_1 /TAXON_ID=2856 /ORGANISM="Cylindrotheca closterium" /LENGTH=204 /DNA_ID=CAMNT_0000530387 /DNA_START=12 /DNA_END=626 /DNA_ORIENTATION=- /assembly_acc=CAM_ASM_000147